MYDVASCEKRGDVAEVPPQRLLRMVIRLGRCMTRRRFVCHVMQELISAAPPMVAMVNGMMSGAGVPPYMTSGADVPSYMTSGAGGERTRSSCSQKKHSTFECMRWLSGAGSYPILEGSFAGRVTYAVGSVT